MALIRLNNQSISSVTALPSAISTGISMFDTWRLTTNKTGLAGQQTIDANWERVDAPTGYGTIGSAMTESSGVFSFPETGIYQVFGTFLFYRASGSANYMAVQMLITTDNSTYNVAVDGGVQLRDDPSAQDVLNTSFIFDVTSTTNCKLYFKTDVSDAQTLLGNTDKNQTYVHFIKLGNT